MIKGVHPVKKHNRSGVTWYYYAWRGGPLIWKHAGEQKLTSYPQGLIDAYSVAVKERDEPRHDFNQLVTRWERVHLPRLAKSTQKNYTPWAIKLAKKYGRLHISEVERPKFVEVLERYHQSMRDTPRTADYMLQVMSNICGFGVKKRVISVNPAASIEPLYKSDRSLLIWEPKHFEAIRPHVNDETYNALTLAGLTGLRLSDVVSLKWSDVYETHIVVATGKSRGKRDALIKMYGGLRSFLKALHKRSPYVVPNTTGKAYTADGISSNIGPAKRKAGIEHLNTHDLRGTFVTKLYAAGWTNTQVAEAVGWSEKEVKRIKARYVNAQNIVLMSEARTASENNR